MTRFHVGTSGWHYDHWRGVFYPNELPKQKWFAYYADHFDTVELNNSFYRLPDKDTWQDWHDAAPSRFTFAVKASRFVTHMKRFKDTGEPLDRFLNGARRLKSHLGPVLYQAPPNFECSPINFQRLGAFLEALPGSIDSVVEFRHRSWFGEDTLAMLRRHGVALCIQDMPGSRSPIEATASFAYVRLHGHERAYRGNYGAEALKDWADELDGLARRGLDDVWVYFNNDLEGHAVENARALRDLVGAPATA